MANGFESCAHRRNGCRSGGRRALRLAVMAAIQRCDIGGQRSGGGELGTARDASNDAAGRAVAGQGIFAGGECEPDCAGRHAQRRGAGGMSTRRASSMKCLATLLLSLLPVVVMGAEIALPGVRVEIADQAGQQQELALALKVLLGLTVLSLAPALMIMMTSFTRIILVMSMLRHALGMQQTPPN